jgi:hypothetical protein
VRPFGAPQDPACVLIQREQERPGILIADHQERVPRQNRRGAMPEGVVERTQRHPPQFVPIGPVGKQSEILEEYIDVSAVARRRCGNWTVGWPLNDFLARPGSLPPPQNSPIVALQRNREKCVLLERREKDLVTGD